MSIRGSITLECDQKGCHAELVLDGDGANVTNGRRLLTLELLAPEWHQDEQGDLWCPDCANHEERDEAHERAAARARDNNFAETGGKDWT